jgi:hypothetical protein
MTIRPSTDGRTTVNTILITAAVAASGVLALAGPAGAVTYPTGPHGALECVPYPVYPSPPPGQPFNSEAFDQYKADEQAWQACLDTSAYIPPASAAPVPVAPAPAAPQPAQQSAPKPAVRPTPKPKPKHHKRHKTRAAKVRAAQALRAERAADAVLDGLRNDYPEIADIADITCKTVVDKRRWYCPIYVTEDFGLGRTYGRAEVAKIGSRYIVLRRHEYW